MNCKPGDLAIVIGPSDTPNLGRVVRCVRLLEKGEELSRDGYVFDAASHAMFWEVEGRISCLDSKNRQVEVHFGLIGDRWMRPIRDPGDDARDEMLRPLPQEVSA